MRGLAVDEVRRSNKDLTWFGFNRKERVRTK